MALGNELDPSDLSIGLGTLRRGNERHQPVLVQVPTGAEGFETKFLRCGRGTLQLGGLSSRSSGSGERRGHNPVPSGSGKRERRWGLRVWDEGGDRR